MNAVLDRVTGRTIVIGIALVMVVGALLAFRGGPGERTVTAHFSRAVSIYPGSDVRMMGVRIGSVTAVVPEGDSVRVSMKYDAAYKVPAGAKAAIVTPTLVADRYVQLAPAYSKGPVLADGADIKLADTGTPVELDRIYQSLATLSEALGPNGVNKDGTLNHVLQAGSKALKGRGALANRTIRDLAAATTTFGDNADPLFSNVRQLAQFTNTLAENDQVVDAFMGDLAGVSHQLSGERGELRGVLIQLAKALGTVRSFVADNRAALTTNVKQLTSTVGALAKEKDALVTVLEKGPLGIGNLSVAYDVPSGSIGARIQFGPTPANFGNFLCGVVANSGVKDPAVCALLKQITAPLGQQMPNIGAGPRQSPRFGNNRPASSFDGLLGGGR